MQTETSNPLTPTLCALLQHCAALKTTNAKILAIHLNRSPATIRTQFQRILVILEVNCRYAALKKAESEGWINTKQH